jgi:hypothetical protein
MVGKQQEANHIRMTRCFNMSSVNHVRRGGHHAVRIIYTFEKMFKYVSCVVRARAHTDKKENQNFPIYKEIQNGAVAKSYITNGLLIYGEIFPHFLIYWETLPHILLCNCSTLNFLIYGGKIYFLFYQCRVGQIETKNIRMMRCLYTSSVRLCPQG